MTDLHYLTMSLDETDTAILPCVRWWCVQHAGVCSPEAYREIAYASWVKHQGDVRWHYTVPRAQRLAHLNQCMNRILEAAVREEQIPAENLLWNYVTRCLGSPNPTPTWTGSWHKKTQPRDVSAWYARLWEVAYKDNTLEFPSATIMSELPDWLQKARNTGTVADAARILARDLLEMDGLDVSRWFND